MRERFTAGNLNQFALKRFDLRQNVVDRIMHGETKKKPAKTIKTAAPKPGLSPVASSASGKASGSTLPMTDLKRQ